MIVSVTMGRIYGFFPKVTEVLAAGWVSPSTVVIRSSSLVEMDSVCAAEPPFTAREIKPLESTIAPTSPVPN